MAEDLSLFDILPYLMIGGFIYFILRSVMQFKIVMSSVSSFAKMPGQHETPEYLANQLREDGLHSEADDFMNYVRELPEGHEPQNPLKLNLGEHHPGAEKISAMESAQSIREKISLIQEMYLAQQRDRFTDIDRAADILKNINDTQAGLLKSATRDLLQKYITLLTHQVSVPTISDEDIRRRKKDVL